MTAVTSTPSTTAAAASTGTAASSAAARASSLGIKDFLTLMTSQLKYQDPTDPQKSSEFVAQLAQFSSVSGIQEMNTSMSSMLSEFRNSQALNATSLVGHDVLLEASSMPIGSGGSASGAVQTPAGATDIQLVVSDSSGQIVRQMTVPALQPLSTFTWDGQDDAGRNVASGTYSFKALATVAGKSESATTLLADKVSSVTINATDNSLTLNTNALGPIGMSAVRQIM